MFEVSTLSQGVNVALLKPASQSSTLRRDDVKFGANNAIDGDSLTFSHTEDLSAWWMVDLEAMFPVETVNITNRWCQNPSDANGCLCRLSGATVSLLDENYAVVATSSINNTCGALQVGLDFKTPCMPVAPTVSPTMSCLPKAQIVKLHQPNTGLPIQVFEVKVLNSYNLNIAKGGIATQSSTFKNSQAKFGANNAVDGDFATFTHTDDPSPWWQVDVGENYDISSIEIVNRWCSDINDSANCLCRLSGATITLIDDHGTDVTSISTGSNTCGQANLEFVFESSPEFCQSTVSFFFICI